MSQSRLDQGHIDHGQYGIANKNKLQKHQVPSLSGPRTVPIGWKPTILLFDGTHQFPFLESLGMNYTGCQQKHWYSQSKGPLAWSQAVDFSVQFSNSTGRRLGVASMSGSSWSAWQNGRVLGPFDMTHSVWDCNCGEVAFITDTSMVGVSNTVLAITQPSKTCEKIWC